MPGLGGGRVEGLRSQLLTSKLLRLTLGRCEPGGLRRSRTLLLGQLLGRSAVAEGGESGEGPAGLLWPTRLLRPESLLGLLGSESLLRLLGSESLLRLLGS